MMSEASFASLGPTLLARKGGAKPAMRPQLTPLPDNMAEIAALADEQLEDLGWNDMGGDDGEVDKELIISTTPAPTESAEVVSLVQHPSAATPANEDTIDATSPMVREHQKRLAKRILGDAASQNLQAAGEAPLLKQKETAKPAKKTVKSKAKGSGRRAAFTLRLDTDRHLKLRLASTMQGVSAQSLVTEALDALLENIDDLDALVARMKRD
jgi:predicted HicB family RNase H-like nuclease